MPSNFANRYRRRLRLTSSRIPFLSSASPYPPMSVSTSVTWSRFTITVRERRQKTAGSRRRRLRYQHASDIRTDLQRLKRDTESGKAVSSGTATSRWSRRTILISAIALASVVALIAVRAFYFGSSGRTRINSVAVRPSLMPARPGV